MKEYEQKAEEFLRRNKLQMNITQVPYTPPIWEDEKYVGRRNKYSVTIHRPLKSGHDGTLSYERRIRFDFWGSINDAAKGRHLSVYDVLSCISSDVFCPDTFEEFCSEYGYDKDCPKAEETFELVNEFAERLRSFFSEEEITELQKIR